MYAIRFALAALCALVLSTTVSAGVWNEVGDAADLPPGQDTVGAGLLDAINGTMDVSGDADLFRITITNPAAFSASTLGGTSMDTQLFLFNAAGIGVTSDDDDPGGSGVQSVITGQFVPSSGVYFLAISTYNTDPVTGAAVPIWLNQPFAMERAPDGPGAASPVAGWNRDTFADTGAYTISLTGAEFGTVPEPATALLLGLGLLVMRLRNSHSAVP